MSAAHTKLVSIANWIEWIVRGHNNMCIMRCCHTQRYLNCISVGVCIRFRWNQVECGMHITWWHICMLTLSIQLWFCVHSIILTIIEIACQRLAERWKSKILDLQWIWIFEFDNGLQRMFHIHSNVTSWNSHQRTQKSINSKEFTTTETIQQHYDLFNYVAVVERTCCNFNQ